MHIKVSFCPALLLGVFLGGLTSCASTPKVVNSQAEMATDSTDIIVREVSEKLKTDPDYLHFLEIAWELEQEGVQTLAAMDKVGREAKLQDFVKAIETNDADTTALILTELAPKAGSSTSTGVTGIINDISTLQERYGLLDLSEEARTGIFEAVKPVELLESRLASLGKIPTPTGEARVEDYGGIFTMEYELSETDRSVGLDEACVAECDAAFYAALAELYFKLTTDMIECTEESGALAQVICVGLAAYTYWSGAIQAVHKEQECLEGCEL